MYSKGFMGQPVRMSRRGFLKLSGAGIAGATLLALIGSWDAPAQDLQYYSSLLEEFEEAAEEYDVPLDLLLAIGYVNTRWEMPPPEASAYEPGDLHGRGAYGIMQLVQNDTADTLGEASRLTDIPEEELIADRRSNILGGAALLAESQGEKPATLSEWFGAIDGRGGNGKIFEAVAGIGAGEIFAGEIFRALREGPSETTLDGEQIALEAREEALGALAALDAQEEALEELDEELKEALEMQEEALEALDALAGGL